MVDMSHFIAPKSDQINADDLLAGPVTITISRVRASEGTPEQPVEIHIEGSVKPYKPCKSMRRAMVVLWGADTSQYTGRSMTLYRDPKVLWGGMEVGGIRISHMSHIERDSQIALTASKTKRAMFVVKKLAAPTREPEPEPDTNIPTPEQAIEMITSAATMNELGAVWKTLAETRRAYPDHIDALTDLKDAKKLELVEAV